ncbi:MAG: RNA 2',3'-cyclic phosphodiesterase [Fimbriimonas sp.]
MKRLFVGIEVAGGARLVAETILEHLRVEVVHQGVRWIRPEKLHLTLVFIGHVPEDRIEALGQACARAAAGVPPLSLELTGLGGFPHLKRPKVVWLGIGESPDLFRLQGRLVDELAPLARLEDREYHPHVTLGRISPGSPKVGARVQSLAAEMEQPNAMWPVADIVLFESTTDGRYESLGRFPLSTL